MIVRTEFHVSVNKIIVIIVTSVCIVLRDNCNSSNRVKPNRVTVTCLYTLYDTRARRSVVFESVVKSRRRHLDNA